MKDRLTKEEISQRPQDLVHNKYDHGGSRIFIDREDIQFEEALSSITDPTPREETELHILMAEAAFDVYSKTVISTSIPA